MAVMMNCAMGSKHSSLLSMEKKFCNIETFDGCYDELRDGDKTLQLIINSKKSFVTLR